jgi:hypothetical protein
MRRWLVSGFIASYLGFLGYGIASHALGFQVFVHPVMYFAVWDMFCGWQAYETRIHVVAEGESGQLYQLSPPPWSDFAPFGDLSRAHYDAFGHSFRRIGMNTLENTEHEPIRRFFAVEECWQKKYNLPDEIWATRFDEPKDPYSYFWLRASFTPDGNAQYAATHFTQHAYGQMVSDNPRLLADSRRGRPFFSVNPNLRETLETPLVPQPWGTRPTTPGAPYGN